MELMPGRLWNAFSRESSSVLTPKWRLLCLSSPHSGSFCVESAGTRTWCGRQYLKRKWKKSHWMLFVPCYRTFLPNIKRANCRLMLVWFRFLRHWRSRWTPPELQTGNVATRWTAGRSGGRRNWAGSEIIQTMDDVGNWPVLVWWESGHCTDLFWI